ncbi:hypothetical protein RJT34_11291 [Clitoria ternatea]|uniref:FAE domain-containing protein n=1 Tax=Clitoria ternatea TaxID=43366 RepID=A0AAN9JJV1_CLITE
MIRLQLQRSGDGANKFGFFGKSLHSLSHHYSFTPTPTVLLVVCLSILYLARRRKAPIYLIDYACYCPPSSCRFPIATFEENQLFDGMDPEAIAFQCKIISKSGFSEETSMETSISPSLFRMPKIKALSFALEEAETTM